LSRGLVAMDFETRKERRKEAAKKNSFGDDDAPMAAPDAPKEEGEEDEGEGEDAEGDQGDDDEKNKTPRQKPEEPQPTPRDQLKSAAKRVKERHVALRVKNLIFLSSLNEEAMRAQAKLRTLLDRSDGALLPEVSVAAKERLFELISQLLDSALAECSRMLANPSAPAARILERCLGFILALEHGKEIAMPTDSRTQALKLAGLVDKDLLCQVLDGPFRRRLLSAGVSRRRDSTVSAGPPPLPGHRSRSSGCGLGGGSSSAAASAAAASKAWEEAGNAFCVRMVQVVRDAFAPPPSEGGEFNGEAT